MGARASKPVTDMCSLFTAPPKAGSTALDRGSSPSASSSDQVCVSPRSDCLPMGDSRADLLSAKSSWMCEDPATVTISLVVEDAEDLPLAVPLHLGDEEAGELLRAAWPHAVPEGCSDLLLIHAETQATVPVSAASVREGERYKVWFHDAEGIKSELDLACSELSAHTQAVESLTQEKLETLRVLAVLRREHESNETRFLEEAGERATMIAAEWNADNTTTQ